MKIKSSVLISLFALTTAVSAFAKPENCFFTNHYHADNQSLVIIQTTSDNNTQITKTSNFSFDFHDLTCPPEANVHNTGTVIYSSSNGSQCTLSIVDGELMADPDLTANCSGNLKYAGYTYDGFLTYGYTLHFQQS